MTTQDLPADAAERAWAEFGRLFPNTMWPWEDLSADERDRWGKVIAQAAAAGPRWHCTRDHVTVPCGECDPCRRDHADAFLAGREAERERIREHILNRVRQLAAPQNRPAVLELEVIASELGWTGESSLPLGLRQDGDTP